MQSRSTFMDVEWTRTGWDSVTGGIDRLSPVEISRALEALRTVFPPDVVSTLQGEGHPIVYQQHFLTNRMGLIEIGDVLAKVGSNDTDRKRLRNAAEYTSMIAELRAAGLLLRAGAHIERPVASVGTREWEYTAEFPSGTRLAIEVKLPRTGEKQNRHDVRTHRLLHSLTNQLPTNDSPHGRAIVSLRSEGLSLPDAAFQHHAAFMAEAFAHQLGSSSVFGSFDVEPLGSIHIVPDENCAHLQIEVQHEACPSEATRLLRRILRKARRQLGAAPMPGVLIIDQELNPLVRNAAPLLGQWAASQPQLAAVLLFDRHFMGNRMYDGVEFFPGPQFHAAEPLLNGALEFCSSSHVHYCALSSLVDPCPCDGWFRQLRLTG